MFFAAKQKHTNNKQYTTFPNITYFFLNIQIISTSNQLITSAPITLNNIL